MPSQVRATSKYLSGLLEASADNQTVGIFMTDTYGSATQFITGMRAWQVADPTRPSRLTFLFSNVSFVGAILLASRLKCRNRESANGGDTL